MKKLSLILPILLSLAFVLPVRAADVVNIDTGAESENNARYETISISREENINDTSASNEVAVNIGTGKNESSSNTGTQYDPKLNSFSLNHPFEGIGGGSVISGDASFTVEITNTLNTNNTKISYQKKPEQEGIGGGDILPPVSEKIPPAGMGGGDTALTLPAAGQNTIGLSFIVSSIIFMVIFDLKKLRELYKNGLIRI